MSPECLESRLLLAAAPVAVDDLVQTTAGQAVSFDPLANDVPADGHALSLTAVSGVDRGAVSITGDTLTFTPQAGFVGQDTFAYSANDGAGNSVTGSVVVTVNAAGGTPANRPFGQHVDYAGDAILPSHVSQSELDDDVRAFYNDWKAKYLVVAGTRNGQPLYRVSFSQGSAETVSEGQGWGMVITAYLAGHDPDAREIFDGLWSFSRANPSTIDSRLMDWHTPTNSDGNNSAFDGDADIAYGLLLAATQWSNNRNVNYAAEAATVIAGIYESTIGPNSRLPELGDWVSANGSPFNENTPRPSDFMPSHFRSYGRATDDPRWDTVVAATQAVVDSIQTSHSPGTGLLPDFVVNASTNPQPAPGSFLEGPYDNSYSYNSARVPLRLGLDGLLNGDAASIEQALRISHWAESTAGGNPHSFQSGYRLNGTPLPARNYMSTAFVAPLGVAAMNDPSQQSWLNSIYDTTVAARQNYFEDTIALLSLIAMSGNYWDPVPADSESDPPPDDDSVLTIDAANDNIAVSAINGVVQVLRNGNVDSTIGDRAAADIRSIHVSAGNAANRIDLSGVTTAAFNNVTVHITSGDGNDTVIGSDFRDNIDGGAGDDRLDGGPGDDVLSGGIGRDVLFGRTGNDELHGNGDNDRLYGHSGDDSLFGGDGRDRLMGHRGNDVLRGNDGNDILRGGVGHDILIGGEGRDRLLGQRGDDTLVGGAGPDLLIGGAGNDGISGGPGDDRATGGSGDDSLIGGDGNNTLFGGSGQDIVIGGPGNDRLSGQSGTDTVVTGEGDDTVTDPSTEIDEDFELSVDWLNFV